MGLFTTSKADFIRKKKSVPEDDPALADDMEFDLPDVEPSSSYKNKFGGKTTLNDDGSVDIGLEPESGETVDGSEHDDNLAEVMAEHDLAALAEQLIMGIDADLQSRGDADSMSIKAMTMCGLKIEDVNAASDGNISKVHHTLLLESVIRYQSNAGGELLPASGPVKVRDDRPIEDEDDDMMPPGAGILGPAGIGHNGGPPLNAQPPSPAAMPPPGMDPSMAGNISGIAGMPNDPGATLQPMQMPADDRAALADALESDMNHYLTAVAKEYYPDFYRMLFGQALFGSAFKKIYHCPLRRRPVSDYISFLDLIVSNDATDLYTAGRVTHRTKMRQSVMKRMQILGVYREAQISTPVADSRATEKKVKQIEGIAPTTPSSLPADIEHTMYETYTEHDLKGFEDKDENGEATGLPLPYKITLEKDSRKILEIRRNWKEGDDTFTPRRRFVHFGFIPGLGFYHYGLMHILGNTQKTLTAIERQLLDAGMFANFPGFLVAKSGSRQTTLDMKVRPGAGREIDTGGMPLSDMVMELPYKDPSQVLSEFAGAIAGDARAMVGLIELPSGEGIANIAPGTMLAMIEQATKVTGAIHKRNHSSHQEELEILRELFAEDPSAIWKFSKKTPQRKWQIDQEFQDLSLVPASDPNVSSHIQRLMLMTALVQRSDQHPELYDAREVEETALRALGFQNIDKLLKPVNQGPPQQGADPETQNIILQANARKAEQFREIQQEGVRAKSKMVEKSLDMKAQAATLADKERDRQSKEKIALINAHKEVIKSKATTTDNVINAKKDLIKSHVDLHTKMVDHAGTMEKTTQAKHKKEADIAKAKAASAKPASVPKPKKSGGKAKKAKEPS